MKDFPDGGGGACQPIMLGIFFPENCMKLKKFGPRAVGGGGEEEAFVAPFGSTNRSFQLIGQVMIKLAGQMMENKICNVNSF